MENSQYLQERKKKLKKALEKTQNDMQNKAKLLVNELSGLFENAEYWNLLSTVGKRRLFLLLAEIEVFLELENVGLCKVLTENKEDDKLNLAKAYLTYIWIHPREGGAYVTANKYGKVLIHEKMPMKLATSWAGDAIGRAGNISPPDNWRDCIMTAGEAINLVASQQVDGWAAQQIVAEDEQ